jgi:hypothetical protein
MLQQLLWTILLLSLSYSLKIGDKERIHHLRNLHKRQASDQTGSLDDARPIGTVTAEGVPVLDANGYYFEDDDDEKPALVEMQRTSLFDEPIQGATPRA